MRWQEKCSVMSNSFFFYVQKVLKSVSYIYLQNPFLRNFSIKPSASNFVQKLSSNIINLQLNGKHFSKCWIWQKTNAAQRPEHIASPYEALWWWQNHAFRYPIFFHSFPIHFLSETSWLNKSNFQSKFFGEKLE